MAEKSTRNKSAATKSAAKPKAEVKKTEQEVSAPAVENIVPKEIDPNMYITVKNGFQGDLVYKSARTGETFIWDGFGSEQEIELRELRNAKNNHKYFYINNWFMFDEKWDWVIDYLGVRQYYKNALTLDGFEHIFEKSADEIKKVIAGLSDGQKETLKYKALYMVSNGEIDSIKKITALEDVLNIELIER